MSVNTLTFEQCSTVLNSLVQQATGRSSVISTEADFISVAQTALSVMPSRAPAAPRARERFAPK